MGQCFPVGHSRLRFKEVCEKSTCNSKSRFRISESITLHAGDTPVSAERPAGFLCLEGLLWAHREVAGIEARQMVKAAG